MPNTNTDTTTIDDNDNALAIDHPRVRLVDREIFTLRFVSDCMTHACLCRDEKDLARTDACCQHGADVLREEKTAILRRAAEIGSVLKPEWKKSETWFDERDPEVISEEPFVDVVRTGTTDLDVDTSGCIFLNHEGERGCGLHAAALKHGFDPAEIKPSVCRLYPLSLDDGRLGLSPDFDRYSCANSGTSSIYGVLRGVLGEMYGDDLVQILDGLNAKFRVRRLKSLR
jgi:Fe-S-cluster containining protein